MLYATGRYGSFEGFEPIPQKIWQMWITDRNTSVSFFEDRGRLTYTTNWMEKNPDYRYELLTDNAVRTYVRTKYRHRQDIVDTYERITDVILAADYIRYLAILADGGLYTDVDTECTVPVDDWIPPEHRNRTGLVVGIEYDAQDGEIQGDFDLRVQLCQWTFMGRAGHPVMQHVVEQITKALQSFAPNGSAIAVTEGNFEDILWLTGPRIFTVAILEGLSIEIGRPVTSADITNLKAPELIGDVLFMPVNAFASGQTHSGSLPYGNEHQLSAHQFRGFQTWKLSHPGLKHSWESGTSDG